MNLRAPFPYFGYKGKVSAEVWQRLGDVPNYVEPFAGSLAVLLQRPQAGKREVVNDRSGGLCNFWRAVKADPRAVAKHAVHVSSESDLHARNAAVRAALPELTSRLEGDPEYFDAKLAGWWLYVQCCAIGEAAYAKGPWVQRDGLLVSLRDQDRGIRRAVPCDQDRGIQRAVPFHSAQGLLSRVEHAMEWLERLCARLINVRILCGNWSRACKPTYTVQHGLTGVFLDPPYDTDCKCYSEHDPLLGELVAWCIRNGDSPHYRIALCGYDGTLPVDLTAHGWVEHAWKSGGGRITTGGQSDANRERERIWFSPHCLQPEAQLNLFGEAS